MNYINLFRKSNGKCVVAKDIGYVRVTGIRDIPWNDMDFSELPYGISIRNKIEGTKLLSLTLNKYRFKNVNDLCEFIENLTYEDLSPIIEELTELNNKINDELGKKVESEVAVFNKILQDNNLDFVSFYKLYKTYADLPCYMRKYYKTKYSLSDI